MCETNGEEGEGEVRRREERVFRERWTTMSEREISDNTCMGDTETDFTKSARLNACNGLFARLDTSSSAMVIELGG